MEGNPVCCGASCCGTWRGRRAPKMSARDSETPMTEVRREVRGAELGMVEVLGALSALSALGALDALGAPSARTNVCVGCKVDAGCRGRQRERRAGPHLAAQRVCARCRLRRRFHTRQYIRFLRGPHLHHGHCGQPVLHCQSHTLHVRTHVACVPAVARVAKGLHAMHVVEPYDLLFLQYPLCASSCLGRQTRSVTRTAGATFPVFALPPASRVGAGGPGCTHTWRTQPRFHWLAAAGGSCLAFALLA